MSSATDAGANDPLVPIVPKRLRAALRRRGLSVKAIAKAMHTLQQTVNAIASSDAPRACRQSIRAALAKELNYPEEWLAGTIDWAPDPPWRQRPEEGGVGVPWGGALPALGQPVSRDGPDIVDLPDHQLTIWALSRQILDAWQADRGSGDEGAERAWREQEAFTWFSEDGRHVVSAVARVLDVSWWDRMLGPLPLLPGAWGKLASTGDRAQVSAEAGEHRRGEFAVATGQAIELWLQPWQEGQRPMNYGALSDLLKWIAGGMETPSRTARIRQILDAVEFDQEEAASGAEDGDPGRDRDRKSDPERRGTGSGVVPD